MNLQVISAPDGEILWVSGPLPGSAHDLTAARIWGIVRELAAAGLITLADKAYIGAGEHVLTPYRGRGKPESQKAANRAHARLRAPGERANAQLKTWHILRKLRCCPWKAGQHRQGHPRPTNPRDRRMKKAHCPGTRSCRRFGMPRPECMGRWELLRRQDSQRAPGQRARLGR